MRELGERHYGEQIARPLFHLHDELESQSKKDLATSWLPFANQRKIRAEHPMTMIDECIRGVCLVPGEAFGMEPKLLKQHTQERLAASLRIFRKDKKNTELEPSDPNVTPKNGKHMHTTYPHLWMRHLAFSPTIIILHTMP